MTTLTQVADVLLNADGKALATSYKGAINVIPVSTVKVVRGKIWLINYFFGKTLHNIEKNPHVALAFWKGLEGYQLKGTALHLTEGKIFEQAQQWIAEILPERTVKGLLILTPLEMFDVSAETKRAGKKL